MERSSTRALASDDLELARDRALWARFFNPLSVDPLFALARVEESRGRLGHAERRYIRAVELQPDNPETWYTLGLFEFEALDNLCATYRFLNNAYTLDPSGNQWVKGGPLDIAQGRRQRRRLRARFVGAGHAGRVVTARRCCGRQARIAGVQWQERLSWIQ